MTAAARTAACTAAEIEGFLAQEHGRSITERRQSADAGGPMTGERRAQFLSKGPYMITGGACSNSGPSEIFDTGDIVSLFSTQRVDRDGDVWAEAWDATLSQWDGDWLAADSLAPLDTTED